MSRETDSTDGLSARTTGERVHVAIRNPVEAIEFCFEQGWTDGLPVVPPESWRVEQMLAAGAQPGERILGDLKYRRRRISVEKVAINAVMAGCKPEYFPVVLACVEAMVDPAFGLHLAAASTHSPGILVLVNGPIRDELGVNCSNNAFSPGWRANATIGRTLRLILLNVLGYSPAYFDGGTMGNPAKLTYCVGEYEEVSPWEPLHVERGLSLEASAVTLFVAESPKQVNSRLSSEPEVLMQAMTDAMTLVGTHAARPDEGGFLVVMGPEHANQIASRGWSKTDVRRHLYEHAKRPLADFKRAARVPGELEPGDEERMFPMMRGPEDLFLAVAGSLAGQYTLVIPIQTHHAGVVTKQVVKP